MSSANRLNARFGEPPMKHLSLSHQVFDCTGDILDRNFRIDAMLIEQIDAVGTQSLEGTIDHSLDVVGLAVQTRKPPTGLLIDIPTELGSDRDLISKPLDSLTEDPLIFE